MVIKSVEYVETRTMNFGVSEQVVLWIKINEFKVFLINPHCALGNIGKRLKIAEPRFAIHQQWKYFT
jgi:hypothetical protein